MTSTMKHKNGFTLVEILVTVTIIAIIATITVVSYFKVQADSRNTARDSKIKIVASALERYYEKNGEYPSCSAMTQPGSQVTTTTLPKLDPNALLTPYSAAGSTNSYTCSDLSTTSSSTDAFAYVGDGSSTCQTGTACTQYTLEYRAEGSGNIVSLNSQHKSQLGIAGGATLTTTTASDTQINLSWTAVPNATSYSIQQADDSNFNVNVVNSTSASTTASATGLNPGKIYYFRVIPTSIINNGNWSNTATSTTTITAPAAPTTTAVLSGTTATGTASIVTCEPGTTAMYQLQARAQSNSSALGTWTAWSAWSTTQTTYSVGTAQGYDYDFESQALCQGPNINAASPVSNIASVVMPIATPAAPTMTSPPVFYSTVSAWVDYASYCPGGTWMVNGTFHSHDWLGGNWGPYAFHFWDAWQNVDGHDEPVQYWGSYQCQTSYTTSPLSPESYNVVYVHSS